MTEEENASDTASPDHTKDALAPSPEEKTPAVSPSTPPPDGDRFRPDAIAERIARVGGETDHERAEREAEEKLAARKIDGGDKRSALEIAASKRLAEIGEKAVRRPTEAVVLNRDMEAIKGPLKWIEGNERMLLGGILALVVSVTAFVGHAYWKENRDAGASVALATAIAAENGRIEGEKAERGEKPERPSDAHPVFKTAAERTDAALARFRDVEGRYPHSGAATLARLAEGSLLLDKGDAEGARTAFEQVKQSQLASADTEVKGRALEGIGFAYEKSAAAAPAEKDALLDKAMAAYVDLEAMDVAGLKELAEYHQSRVFEAKGDRPHAIDMLKKVFEAVRSKPDQNAYTYLGVIVEDRLRALDPAAVPPKRRQSPGGLDMNDPEIQRMIQQYQAQMQEQQRKAPAGNGTVPPAPAPAP